MTTLKRHGSWKQAHIAEKYIADSTTNKRVVAAQIAAQIQNPYVPQPEPPINRVNLADYCEVE